jgi:hypothetical protein
MPARLHPGRVLHVWDHFVLGLRQGQAVTASLSLYAVAWSGELGGGTVCLVELPDRRLALADPPVLGERMQARLASMGFGGPGGPLPVIPAHFERHAATSVGLGWTVRFGSSTLMARWERLEAAVWVAGPAPAFRDEEDIWACFVAAREASLTLDGRPIGGRPYDDDAWVPRLGRAFSSAHVALAEVRVTPS